MTDRLIIGITADPKPGNPDQQAERLAMAIAWDEHIAQEAAKRPYLLVLTQRFCPGRWASRPLRIETSSCTSQRSDNASGDGDAVPEENRTNSTPMHAHGPVRTAASSPRRFEEAIRL